ncbi:uncharacterized protein [Cardiocondyla obscurior]|uniref:uncharacterized protein n=1 Tax=Cardiocondyla obscurior TaxID=286306 RepID=UPI0039657B5F
MSDSKRILIDFENINDYSIQLNRWFLISLGAWPQTRSSSRIKKIVVSLQIFIFTSAVAIIMIPCMLYVWFEKEDIKTKLNAMLPLIHRIMGSVNYWMLLTRTKDIQLCIKHMEMDWKIVRRNDHEVMLQYAKIGRFMAGFCAMFMHGSTFIFTAARAMRTTTFMVGNETFRTHPMTCPVYSKIVDVRFNPANQIMLGVQFLSAFVVGSSIIATCSLAAVFAMHACGQLNVLQTWLNELAEEKKSHLAEKKLATIVEHHWRVLRYI